MKGVDIIEKSLELISDTICIIQKNLSIIKTNTSFSKIFFPPAKKNRGDSVACVFDTLEPGTLAETIKKSEYCETFVSLNNIVLKSVYGAKISSDVHIRYLPEYGVREDDHFYLLFISYNQNDLTDIFGSTILKNAVLGHLSGGICHAINNKLSIILGYTGLAAKKAVDDRKLMSDLKAVTESAHEATNLVQSLVKFCRSSDGSENTIRLDILITEVIRFAKSVLPVPISLHFDNKVQNDGYVVVDSGVLYALLALLITESRRILVSSGEIIVELDMESGDVTVGEDTIALGWYYKQAVTGRARDSGRGPKFIISDTTIASIDKMSAKIGCRWEKLESDRGIGGFRFSFLKKKVPVLRQVAAGVSESVQNKTAHILLVEDELMLARLMVRTLERAGYLVTAVSNGDEGYRAWEENTEKFDLILTDMAMPEMTGVELATKVLTKKPGTPIILSTGYSDQVDEAVALRLGIGKYLSKPISNRELLRAIKTCLDTSV